MGRPRKPATVLKMNGGFRKHRHGEGEPASVGVLAKPEGLDEYGNWFWDAHISQVTTNGGGAGDLAEFMSACRWWSWYCRMDALASAGKVDYRTFCMMSMAWKNFNTAASKLGLSPCERAKLRVPPPPKKSKFTKYLEKQG